MGRNVEEMARRAQENPRPDYEGVRSYNPHVPQPIENIGMHVTEQDAENVKSTMERFYGGNQRPEPDAAEIHRFYGRDPAVPAQPDPAAEREREEAMKRFYGHTPYEPRELDDHTARLAHDAAVREYYQRDDGERER